MQVMWDDFIIYTDFDMSLGSKSQGKASAPAVMKDEKSLNPASRRVRDAAENLLSVVMEQVSLSFIFFLLLLLYTLSRAYSCIIP